LIRRTVRNVKYPRVPTTGIKAQWK
jgi:hypothetical protein